MSVSLLLFQACSFESLNLHHRRNWCNFILRTAFVKKGLQAVDHVTIISDIILLSILKRNATIKIIPLQAELFMWASESSMTFHMMEYMYKIKGLMDCIRPFMLWNLITSPYQKMEFFAWKKLCRLTVSILPYLCIHLHLFYCSLSSSILRTTS